MATKYSVARITGIVNHLHTLVMNILYVFPLVPGNHIYHRGFAVTLMTNLDIYIYIQIVSIITFQSDLSTQTLIYQNFYKYSFCSLSSS